MPILSILLALIVVVNLFFVIQFIRDLTRHKNSIMNESANTTILPFSSAIIFFFSTFGISDFAISSALYPKLKWLPIKKLPGTLNTQCVVPVAAMALCYIASIKVDVTTLVVCILCSVAGAYIGPRFVVKLPEQAIKIGIAIGLSVAAVLIFAGLMGWMPVGGELTGLPADKLAIASILLFIYGALNNIGIGSYAPTMVTVYLLGMNPAVAFPIMMGAATFSVPIGGTQFIKFDEYSRKITLFTSIFGLLGVLAAVYVVKSLNVAMLKWVVIAVLIYSVYSMLASLSKKES